jgi:hypothetical protein
VNGPLKTFAQKIPESTIKLVSGSVAVAGAALSLLSAVAIGPNLGVVMVFALPPVLVAIVAFLVTAVLRLRLVGFLTNPSDDVIPKRLQPWIRWWLLLRFGLLGSGFLLIVSAIAVAVLRGPVSVWIQALVYLFILRLLLDMTFGTAFDVGMILTRTELPSERS